MDKDTLLAFINEWRDWLKTVDIDEEWGDGHEAMEELLFDLKKKAGL